jgi:phosphoribosylcarboxyaminoimidazole (NCAIR) mutase
MTFRRFLAYYLVALALTALVAYPFGIPTSVVKLGAAYNAGLERQANELLNTRAALAEKVKEIEALKAKAPEAQASAGGS